MLLTAFLVCFCTFATGSASAQNLTVLAEPVPDITYHSDEHGAHIAGVRCVTPHPSEAELLDIEAALEATRVQLGGETNLVVTTIPVAWHVVRSGASTSQGNVTDQMIADQIAVLNAAFANTNFQFNLVTTTRTTNSSWYTGCAGSQENAMKQALNIDPATTLNAYSCAPTGGILGYSYLPSSWPEGDFHHGIVVLHSTLPGGTAAPYNLGDTATHEVGHFLGLYHTFQGGCSGNGDFVADTPPEASPAFGCPAGRDTCAGGGDDPIENFMDYTDDFCMDEFTSGQSDRIDAQVAAFKPTLLLGGGGDVTISCTPVNPPIVIPAAGGSYSYDIEIVNNGASSETFDIWLDIDGPGVDRTRGPFTRTLAAGGSIMRTLNQNVPGGAPTGDYVQTCSVGAFPTADDSDSFTWDKSTTFAPGGVSVAEWSTEAEFAAAPATAALTGEVPPAYALRAYPNPFNPTSTLTFTLTEQTDVELAVFNTLGQRVALLVDGTMEAGSHQAVFDAGSLPSGIYIYRLRAGSEFQTGQLMLVK